MRIRTLSRSLERVFSAQSIFSCIFLWVSQALYCLPCMPAMVTKRQLALDLCFSTGLMTAEATLLMVTSSPIRLAVTKEVYRSEGGLQLSINIDAFKDLGVSKLLVALKLRRRINGEVPMQTHSRADD